jgi:uncharacterized protein with beta-barrel porin domain
MRGSARQSWQWQDHHAHTAYQALDAQWNASTKILVLSFAKNSVDELRNRLQRSLEQKGNSGKKSLPQKKSAVGNELPTTQTIHAFA